jgi:phage repressor protein C with HTH and peptisase S24 domain
LGWATYHIEKLKKGETVAFRPKGNSMTPKIKSGQLCTVVPLQAHAPLVVGDVVLCRVRGAEYLHLVKAIREGQYLIGNNKGHTNGWVSGAAVFGVLVRVED